jgi:hypothetical protein
MRFPGVVALIAEAAEERFHVSYPRRFGAEKFWIPTPPGFEGL